jgi:hypothetical protein
MHESGEAGTNVAAGRFELFVDGCHAYFRSRARELEISGRDMGIWCECLGEKYKRVMSAEEQCVYANDFEKRYMQRIAGVVSSPDPDWPRLHEVVQQCAR